MKRNKKVIIQYHGAFGWTSVNALTRWFDVVFDKYKNENKLKFHAHKRFGRWNKSVGMEKPIKY
jgi:hypothetical protein